MRCPWVFAKHVFRDLVSSSNSHWYNDDLHNLKREKRDAKRKLNKSGMTVHKQIFYGKCKTYREALNASKKKKKKKKNTISKINKIQDCNQNQLSIPCSW